MTALTDDDIMTIASKFGWCGVIPEDYCKAMGLDPGTRWVAQEVRPEQLQEFARTVVAASQPPESGTLWCVNVWGPDDVYAMPNKAAALERANQMNIEFGSIPRHEHDPIMLAVVIEWPHSPESHAQDLKEQA